MKKFLKMGGYPLLVRMREQQAKTDKFSQLLIQTLTDIRKTPLTVDSWDFPSSAHIHLKTQRGLQNMFSKKKNSPISGK